MTALSIFVFAFHCSVALAGSTDVATERVVEFLTNVHTGKEMRADEWLTRQTRAAPAFEGFGGLDALVRQSTARAGRFGGLGSVQILDAKKVGQGYVVTAQVHFVEDYRKPDNSAVGANEDMVWRFRLINEGGRWMLAF